jgi:hypothetical protein
MCRAGADHDEITAMPLAGVVTDRVRGRLDGLTAGQPLVARHGQQVRAQRRGHLPRLHDGVLGAQQRAGEVAAQRRVDRAGRRRVQHLIAALRRVGERRRLLDQGQLGVVGGQGQGAAGPEADAGRTAPRP